MTAISFIGCATVAFGPILAIFIFHISHYPFLVFLFLSSFIWLVCTLLSAIISYYAFQNLDIDASYYSSLLIFTVIQQASWYLSFKTTSLSEIKIGQDEPDFLKQINHALANGVGLGFTYALLYYSTQLAESAGAGIILSSTCPIDLYFTTGITIMLLSLVYTILTILCFHGHRQNSKSKIMIVSSSLILHYIMAALSKFFSNQSSGCIYVFSIMSAFILISCYSIYHYSQTFIVKMYDDNLGKRSSIDPGDSVID